MLQYISSIPNESIVDVSAEVTKPAEKIESCTQSDVELQLKEVHCVSRSKTLLPF